MDSHSSLPYLILAMNKKLQLYGPFCGSKSRRSLSNKRRTHIAIAIKFDNVSRAMMMAQRNLPGFCCTFRVFVVLIKAVAVSSFVRRGCLTRKTINSLFGAISLKNYDELMGNAWRKQLPSVTIERLTRNDLKRLTRQKRAGRFTFQVYTPRVSNSWINDHISASVVFSATLSICQTSG